MKSFKELVERFKRGPTDLVGIDTGPARTCFVHMRKGGEETALLAADVVERPSRSPAGEETAAGATPIKVPSRIRARYAALAIPGEQAMVRLVSFPGRAEGGIESKIVESLGLEKPEDFRISFKVLAEGHGRTETRALAVAMPETEAAAATALFASGLPVPYSLEVAGLAAMTAFLHGPAPKHKDAAVGLVDFGSASTLLGLFNNETPALIRRFDRGSATVLEKVRSGLGVDEATAAGILADGSFDISHTIAEVMDPLVKQIVISRDFVERRENCHMSRLYLSGGLTVSRCVRDELRGALELDVETWNPFEGLRVQSGAVPESCVGREWMFASAVGACLGTFEET